MSTTVIPLPTKFAPAERADAATIAADVLYFQDQRLLREFAEAAPEFFVVLNEQRQIVYANRALLDALGCASIAEVAGLRPGEAVHCVHAFEEGTEQGICGTTEFCATCGAARAIMRALNNHDDVQECRILLEDGGALDFRVYARPLHENDRKYVLFALNDISDEKRRYVLERIFFHDILNTAGGMAGVAELLRISTPEKTAKYTELVGMLVNSLIDEIRAQQTLLAAERGELKLAVTQMDSRSVLNNLRETYLNHSVCRERQIVIDDNTMSTLFVSDPALVRRVLGNMVKNALEACMAGATVTLSTRPEEDGVAFFVHNPGVMPHAVQMQVFQRSFSSKGEGRGLGTYSARLLSERYLKGTVGFHSEEGAGTTFFACYPLELEAEHFR